jgi:hypothetical protein
LGAQFRRQLDNLMTALNATEPHYIRCIKPNSEKAPDLFSGAMSLQQLRYAGVFEAVRIRQTGYPFRYTHENFLRRYAFLSKETVRPVANNPKRACELLLGALKGNFTKVQVGKTRVLYRAPEQRNLELIRNVAVEKETIKIQAAFRGMRARQLYRKMQKIKPILEAAIKERTLQALNNALDAAKDIEFEMLLITECQKLKQVVLKEKEITDQLTDILKDQHNLLKIEATSYGKLNQIIEDAAAIQFDTALVAQGREIRNLIKRRVDCREALKKGRETSDRAILEEAIKTSEELHFEPTEPLLADARKELERILQEERILGSLLQKMASGSSQQVDETTFNHSGIEVEQLAATIRDSESFGFRTKNGRKALDEAKLLLEIRKCLLAEDYQTLSTVLAKTTTLQEVSESSQHEIQLAYVELAHNTAVHDLIEKTVAATEQHDQDTLAYVVQQAEVLRISDRPEIIQAHDLLQKIIAVRAKLKAAIEAKDQIQLEEATAEAASFYYVREEVPVAQDLLAKVTQINEAADVGLYYLDRAHLESAHNGAEAIGMENAQLTKVKEVLAYDTQRFIQEQLKTANRLKDRARAIRLTIELKDIFFGQFGKMFVYEEFGGFRDVEDFARSKLFGRDQLRLGMKKWTKQPIPTSLTKLDPLLTKLAVSLFKNILGFMGDRPLPYPNALAQELIDQGLATPDIRNEIYCQIMKQLIDNPNDTSVKKGWQLMKFCLQTFPPTDEFINYLEMFLAHKGKGADKYIEMLHDTQYGYKKNQAPSVDKLLAKNEYTPEIDPKAVSVIDPSVVPKTKGYGFGEEHAAAAAAPPTPWHELAPPPPAEEPAPEPTPVPAATTTTVTFAAYSEEAYYSQGYAAAQPTPEPAVPAPAPAPAAQAAPAKKVQVLYEYDGEGDPQRLALTPGMVITVIEDYGGWSYGQTQEGHCGYFPVTYTQPI